MSEQINSSTAGAEHYSDDLAKKLIAAGVESYTVDVSSGITMYRVKDGVTHVHLPVNEPRAIEKHFDRERTINAIRSSRKGSAGYDAFITEIAQAGVRLYDVILTGDNKRCIYMGIGGYYEEKLPV